MRRTDAADGPAITAATRTGNRLATKKNINQARADRLARIRLASRPKPRWPQRAARPPARATRRTS
eukprot:3691181-Lingulodinium_polyedra.AAC.1